jgi:hypothetical protein
LCWGWEGVIMNHSLISTAVSWILFFTNAGADFLYDHKRFKVVPYYRSVSTGGLGFSIQDIGVLGQSPYEIWKVWYIDSRKIYLKLLLRSFNHLKKMETKVGITSDNVTPIHLCETLELVNKKLVSEYVVFWKLCWQLKQ